MIVCNYKIYKLSLEELGMLNNIKSHKIHGLSETIVNGVEPPKLHDVGPLLRKERNKFPAWFQEKIDEFAYYSRVLRSEREPAMYGDEETGTPPEELYSKFDAENATKMCDTIHEFVRKLIVQ
jgi:HEPN domain-containing protein